MTPEYSGSWVESRSGNAARNRRFRRLAELGNVHAVADGGHLRQDRDGDLGRRLGAELETHRPVQAADLVLRKVELREALAARLVVAARADRADVERRRLERLE